MAFHLKTPLFINSQLKFEFQRTMIFQFITEWFYQLKQNGLSNKTVWFFFYKQELHISEKKYGFSIRSPHSKAGACQVLRI